MLSTAKGPSNQTNSFRDNRVKSNMSQRQAAERGDDRDSSQNDNDSSSHESSDGVEVQSNAKDEPVPKRQRLSAQAVDDPVVVRSAVPNQNQQRDGLSVDAQQALVRHLLGNGNQTPTPSARELANAEINAQLQTILLQQRLLLAGGYFPPQFGAVAHFSQNGTMDAIARLASLSGNGLGYSSASLAAPLNAMQLLQTVNSSVPTAGSFGNFLQSSGVPTFAHHLTGRPAVPLSIEADERTLSEFQRLVRKHIELFEAKQEDVESNAQGRNRPIVLGQVGIRCCHCSHLPPKLRCRGSTYYPTTLQGLYQAAQNMATGHLCKRCSHIPNELREELVRLKECKSSAGGGKTYWGDGVRSLGVFEAPTGLRFLPLS